MRCKGEGLEGGTSWLVHAGCDLPGRERAPSPCESPQHIVFEGFAQAFAGVRGVGMKEAQVCCRQAGGVVCRQVCVVST